MDDKDKIERLEQDHKFSAYSANAFVETNGFCTYCDTDCFETRQSYSSSTIDHLLPKSTYPKLEWVQSNCVLACSSCNTIKGKLDILNEDERLKILIDKEEIKDSKEISEEVRVQIIKGIRNYLYKDIRQRNHDYIRIKRLVQG